MYSVALLIFIYNKLTFDGFIEISDLISELLNGKSLCLLCCACRIAVNQTLKDQTCHI